jgi:phage terminase large subunit-like protein
MRFVEAHCRIPEGDHVGGAVHLADFQEDFFYAVYDNVVRTKRAFLSMARKNSKTATIAFIVLVHLVGPEARLNSRISSGARSRKQAAEVYNYASKMAALSPTLSKVVHPTPSGKRLTGIKMNTEYEALSAEGATAHGGSPVLAILDEVGQVKGPKDDFIEAIVTSQGAYDDALLIAISTQAATDADLFSVWLDDAERSGDPRIVAHVYTAPKECELLDRAAWRAANPAMGLFRSEADLAEQADRATRMPTEENSFRWLGLNQRVNRFSPFLSPGVWKATDGGVSEEAFRKGAVYGGLDLAETTDLCAFVLVALWEGVWHVRAWFWKPEATLRDHTKRDRQPYDTWVDKGFIEAVPGVAVDYEYVARKIADLCAPYKVAKIAYDRFRFKTLEVQFGKIGVALPFEPFGQGYVSMAPAMDSAEIAFLKEQVRHGANPVLTMCAANAVVIRDPAGNRKLDKAKSTGRIDGIVALVMAIGVGSQADLPEKPSVYTRRGMLII